MAARSKAIATAAAVDPLLSIPEVARRLDIARTSVYHLIRDGRLARVDIGNERSPRTRIKESVLNAYVERSVVAPLKSVGRAA